MKFGKKYLGKWVAVKNDKVIASGKTLTSVMKKVETKNADEIKYALVPKGFITG